jgi:transposase
MAIPGVGQLTALAFVAAIDDPHPPITRRRRLSGPGSEALSVGGEVDYVGGISKCGDRRVRTLLYEAANDMLTRYKGQLKLKDWGLHDRQAINDAQSASRRLGIIMHVMLRDGTEFEPA